MHRFVKNQRVDAQVYYMPFAKALVAALANQPLVLAMDGSQVGRGCMTLMVGIIYKQRALPLAWIVYRGKKGHTTADRHIAVLELVQPLLPPEVKIILLGDGEYDTVDMLQWIEAHTNWHFVVRTAKSSLVHFGGYVFPLSNLPIEPDKCLVLEQVLFTQEAAYGPLLAMAYWELDYEEPIYLLSNLADAEPASDLLQTAVSSGNTLFRPEKPWFSYPQKPYLRSKMHQSFIACRLSLLYLDDLSWPIRCRRWPNWTD